jgi:glycosyltransferase involved in cell wall biosynthesis
MPRPEISVIVPAYNREALLETTLHSLIGQTLQPLEIIVVDDASTDGTATVAESFGGCVRVVQVPHGGPSAARNAGFAASKGEYIHFFDSDDVAVPNKHWIQMQALEVSGADIAYGPWIRGRIEANTFTPINGVYQQRGLPRRELIRSLLTNWSIVPQACLFHRGILEKVGGFPEDLRTLEDQLLFLKCLLAGAKVVHSPGTLVLYRDDNTDKLSENPDRKKDRCHEWALFQMKAGMACEHYGIDPSQWFGFRARSWAVSRCVGKFEVQIEPDLRRYLACLESGGGLRYRLHECLTRRVSSIQQRILGRRGSRPYRMGRLNEGQIEQIEAAGFRCIL